MRNAGNQRRILLGEDEPEVRNFLAMALRCHGYAVECAEDGNEVLNYLRDPNPNVSALLLDIMMPRKDGLETLREIRRVNQDLPIIMLSSAASPLNVVEAIKCGATDFLGKPVTHDQLRATIEKALDGRNGAPKPVVQDSDVEESESFLAVSPAMKRIQALLRQVGASDVPVLIQGETGTGKEVIARQLHAQSARAQKPFLKLNCAALPSELVESELFGYERGAFTGAFQKKAGMFELADRGTLLLDEIGDMDFKLQAKLLQVLQDQEFQHLGGKETIHVDVRVISATHRDLEKAIEEGRFREDLYYRLNVVRLDIPALRDRRDEILPLAQLFLRKHAEPGTPASSIPAMLRQALLNHDWPGNVRELENLVRNYLILRDPDMVIEDLRRRMARRNGAAKRSPALHELPLCADNPLTSAVTATAAGLPAVEAALPVENTPILHRVNEARKEVESEAILSALHSARWNRKRAAEILKIDYKALLYKMRKLSISNRAGVAKRNGTSSMADNGSDPFEEDAISPAGMAGRA